MNGAHHQGKITLEVGKFEADDLDFINADSRCLIQGHYFYSETTEGVGRSAIYRTNANLFLLRCAKYRQLNHNQHSTKGVII